MKLNISIQAEFDDAVAKGLFAIATSIIVAGLNVKELPKMPVVTDLWVLNNAALTSFDAPVVTYLRVENNPVLVVEKK